MDVYRGELAGQALASELERSQVDYAISRFGTPADTALAELPTTRLLAEIGPFAVYGVGE
jgi:hypothetical protein